MTPADELIERLLADGSQDTAGQLLTELHRGYPATNLRRLLSSDNPEAVKAGTWLASELGEHATPLLDDVPALLTHPHRYVRFFALDVVLAAAGADRGQLLAQAIELSDDDDEAVRWKAMQLLARANQAQLAAAVPHLHDNYLQRLTSWLSETPQPADIQAALADHDQRSRRFGAAAAARAASSDRGPLQAAAASPDTEIARFAQEQLNLLK